MLELVLKKLKLKNIKIIPNKKS